jgi:hypothetical protein
VVLQRNAGTGFDFEITGEPMEVRLGHDMGATPGDGFEMEVNVFQNGVRIYAYPEVPEDEVSTNNQSFTRVLPPGSYTVSSVMTIATTSSDSIRQEFALELSVGEEPDDVPLPAQGDYTHPDIFTERDATGILQILNPQIVAETDLGGGITEMRVTTSVDNPGIAPWPDVRIAVAETVEGEPGITVVSLPDSFAIGANTTDSPAGEAVLQVAAADVPAVRAALLDGTRFRLSGAQQAVFAYPVKPLEAGAFEDAPSSSINNNLAPFTFPYAPTIGSGTVWLEWESTYKEPLITIIEQEPGNTLLARIQGRDRLLPAMVRDVRRIGSSFQVSFFDPQTGGPGAAPLPLPLVMKEGLVETKLTFDEHPDGFGVTEIPETRQTNNGLSVAGFVPAPVPFHFNQIEISSGVTVSGSFGFRPEELTVALEMKDFAVDIFEVRTRYRADCNLLLETEEGADNSAEPIAGREATLLDLPLLQISLPSGFSFSPRLVLEAGALISAPTSLSIPLTAGLDVSVTAGVRDGEPYYDSDFTPIPLQVSDPGLYEALAATAEVYLDCEIKALFGASGGAFQSGPTLGARAEATFELAPLADPWWSANAKLETFAGVEFNLAGIVTIVDAEQTLTSWDLEPFFPIDSGGPLFGVAAAQSFVPQPGFEALGNPRTRWIRSLLPAGGGLFQGRTFAVPLEGTTDLLAGSGGPSKGLIARLSATGELVWALEDPVRQLSANWAVAESDGGFTVLSGQRGVVRMARFDGAGNVLWTRSIAPSNGTIWFSTNGLERREVAGGASEYFVLGWAIGSSLGGNNVSLIKLDDTGNVLWSKIYPVQPTVDEGTDTTPGTLGLTAAGDVLVVGSTDTNVPAGGLALENITTNGLVFKVDGDTGDVLWTTVVGNRFSTTYAAVSESPTGDIYVGGNSLRTITSELPTMLLTKLDAEGGLIDSVLIGSAASNAGLPLGAETPYDTIYDMAWVDGNLWMCGTIGLYNGGSVGSANGRAPFTAMVNEKLDISRFVMHDGPASDEFRAIAATPDGIFVTGYSHSFHPWPSGASDEADASISSLLALMLPWEGRIRFHEASSGRQPEPGTYSPRWGSYFVTPRARATSQFTIETNQSLFAGLAQGNLTNASSSAPLIVPEDYTTTAQSFSYAPQFFTPEEFKQLEFVPDSLITDLSSYLDYYQLPAGVDVDGDDLTTEMEFFLGTDLQSPEWGVIEFAYLIDEETSEPIVQFTLPRSLLAGSSIPDVYSSIDLAGFDLRLDVAVYVEPVDAQTDRLFLELPAPVDKEFYRLSFPE